MKLLYFRLKGYINILQGMGLDEIEIPFDRLRSKIILIQGENGTGKSTILNTMVPSPDSSDSFRTDVRVDENGINHIIEYPAEKELHYCDEEGSIYKVLIKSVVNDAMTSRTTKAYISKDGVEYNPNGNISSFKDFRDELFDINPTYLDMSSISSENRGLVDMIPSERRKYLSSFIGSVETFNNIFKSLSKTVASIKTEITNLNGRIYVIGDSLSIETTLDRKVDELASYKNHRDSLLKDISAAQSEINVLDPNKEIQNAYTDIANELNLLKEENTKNEELVKNAFKEIGSSDPYKELDSINSHLDKLEKTNSKYISKIDSLSMYLENIKSDIMKKKSKLEKITSSDYDSNISLKISKLEEDIKFYQDKIGIKALDAMSKISKDDIDILYNGIMEFNNSMNVIKDSDEYLLSIAVKCILNNTHIDSELSKVKDEISNIQNSLSSASRELELVENDINSLKLLEQRPKTCKDDSCAFIKNLIDIKDKYDKLHKSPNEVYNDINSNINNMNDTLKKLSKRLVSLNDSANIYYSISNATVSLSKLTSLISKFKPLLWLNDQKELLSRVITNRYNLSSELGYIEKLKTLMTDIENYNSINSEYMSLKEKYGDVLKSRSEIDSINSDIKELEKIYNEKTSEMDSVIKDLSFSKNIVSEVTSKKLSVENVINLLEDKDKLNDRMDDLRSRYSIIKDNIKIIKDNTDKIIVLEKEISNTDNMISSLDDEVAELKFKLANLMVYKDDIARLKEKFEKASFIRNLCSQTNGNSIQAEYVKMYMNDIIVTCNSLLKYMFNGDLVLQLPVIGERDFSIPFIGPFGMVVPDISNGSTAQKCMIGLAFNCASMMKMSSKYNLFRLDEIDGGLDTNNRYGFITALNYLLNVTHAEQCIMVSHNIEFDTQSVSRIICTKRNGLKIE